MVLLRWWPALHAPAVLRVVPDGLLGLCQVDAEGLAIGDVCDTGGGATGIGMRGGSGRTMAAAVLGGGASAPSGLEGSRRRASSLTHPSAHCTRPCPALPSAEHEAALMPPSSAGVLLPVPSLHTMLYLSPLLRSEAVTACMR